MLAGKPWRSGADAPIAGPCAPMTLGNMRANGVRSPSVSCWLCYHDAVTRRRPMAGRRAGAVLPSPYGVHRLRHRRRAAQLERPARAAEPDRGAMAWMKAKRRVRRPMA
jgi:hypothetical protein